MKIKRSLGERTGHAIIVAIMFIWALLTLYPFWHVFMYSLSDGKKAMAGGLFLWPRGFSVAQYAAILESSNMLRSFMNSVVRVAVGVPFNIIMSAMLAYPLANKKLAGRGVITMVIFFTMLFGGGMVPTFLLLRDLGLYDNFLVYWLPGAISAYNMFVMRSYFQALPDELEESAFLDGARPTTVLFRIILPCSIPSIAALSMFYGVGHWNSWYDGVIYTVSRDLELFQVLLRNMMMESVTASSSNVSANQMADMGSMTPESLKMAAITLSMIPVLIAYPFIQRYYIKGLMVGAVKG